MGRNRKRRLKQRKKYQKEYLPKLSNNKTVLEQAESAVEDRSSKILESVEPPALKVTDPRVKQPDNVTQSAATSKPKRSGIKYQRGRMIWVVYSSAHKKGDSIKFRSPAVIPPGSHQEQESRAYAVARAKAAQLMDATEDEVVIVQAGGNGEYYDEADLKQDIP